MKPIHASLLLSLLLAAGAGAPVHAASPPTGAGDDWSLGAVVDVRDAGSTGARVLAITPDGAADRIGLRVGDLVLAINGHRLDQDNAATALRQALDAGDGRLRLDVVRDGERLTLAGAADRDALAGTGSGCGFISTGGATPRVTELVFPVRVFDIDGDGTPLAAPSHKLAAGRHVLLLEEWIAANRFDAMQFDRRLRMRERLGASAAKALVVQIAPDTRYMIGARLLPDRLGSAGINSNSFWEPVVWAQEPAPCEP